MAGTYPSNASGALAAGPGMSEDTVTLTAVDDVPEGEAYYPTKLPNQAPQTLASQVVFEVNEHSLLAKTRPISPNRVGYVQVAKRMITELGGESEVSVKWRPARFRDLLKYSKESRRRAIGVILAAISALLAAATEAVGRYRQKSLLACHALPRSGSRYPGQGTRGRMARLPTSSRPSASASPCTNQEET